VNSPYDVGVDYNKEIAAAKAQNALGWSVDLTRTQDGPATQITATVKDKDGHPVSGLDVSLHFFHPANRSLDREITANAVAEGVYSGAAQLTRGHWDAEVNFKRDGERLFRSRNALDIE
jgi:nitrogen fixation protein FixH